MKTSVGTLDRMVRAVLGPVMVATAAFRFCPLCRSIALKTCRQG